MARQSQREAQRSSRMRGSGEKGDPGALHEYRDDRLWGASPAGWMLMPDWELIYNDFERLNKDLARLCELSPRCLPHEIHVPVRRRFVRCWIYALQHHKCRSLTLVIQLLNLLLDVLLLGARFSMLCNLLPHASPVWLSNTRASWLYLCCRPRIRYSVALLARGLGPMSCKFTHCPTPLLVPLLAF